MGRGGSFGGGGGFRGGGGGSFGGGFRGGGGGSFGGGNRRSFGGSGGFRPGSSREGMGLGSSGGFSFGSPGRIHYTGGRIYRGGGGSGMGCGTASILFIFIAIIIVFVLASSAGDLFGGAGGESDVVKSTVVREPLPAGAVHETDYYTDSEGMIQRKTTLTAGMYNFYHKTGIQPYVYITGLLGDSSAAPPDSELDAYTNNLYDELFTDEAHLLLVFFLDDNDNPLYYWYKTGDKARSVMDSEAEDIFEGYINRYYDADLTAEEYFSKVFNDTAERIMSVTTSPWIPVLIVLGVLLILVLLFVWWRRVKKQKNLEAEQTEDMLKTPLEKFGEEDEAEKLARNYDGDPDNDIK